MMNKKRRANSYGTEWNTKHENRMKVRGLSSSNVPVQRDQGLKSREDSLHKTPTLNGLTSQKISGRRSNSNDVSMDERLASGEIKRFSRPAASTPEFHSHGLPVLDTLKRAFRKDSSSELSSANPKSRLSLTGSGHSRSVIEDSLQENGDGSYLECFSGSCQQERNLASQSNSVNNKRTNGKYAMDLLQLSVKNQDPKSISNAVNESDSTAQEKNSFKHVKADCNQRSIDCNQRSADCNQRSADCNQRSIDCNRKSIDVNQISTDDICTVNNKSQSFGTLKDKSLRDPLQGVIAFVDVRSNNENRFEGVARELERMGATVVKKFTSDVTHVVFKDGRKSTLNMVDKHNVHFVSVLWVDSCKQTWSRSNEEDFTVTRGEVDSPLATLRGKTRRIKSLQPKAYDEDLNHSGKLEDKRRKRNIMKEKNNEFGLDQLLCDNTTKLDISKIMQEPESIANSPLGPESPFLKQVKKRWAEKRASLGESPPEKSALPCLVEKEETNLDESPKVSSTVLFAGRDEKQENCGLDGAEHGKRKIEFLGNDDDDCESMDVRIEASDEGNNQVSSDHPTLTKILEPTDCLSTRSNQQGFIPNYTEIKAEESKRPEDYDIRRKGQFCDERSTGIVKKLSKTGNEKEGQSRKDSNKKRKLLSKDHTLLTLNNSKTNATHKQSLQIEDAEPKGVTVKNLESKKRKRLPSPCSRKKQKNYNETESCSNDTVTRLNNNMSNTASLQPNLDDNSCSKTAIDNYNGEKATDKLRAQKTDDEYEESERSSRLSERKSKAEKKRRSLVMTSLHDSEQTFIRTAVTKLQSFKLAKKVNPSTTHVVAGGGRRTLNILNAVIQGCWILSPDWVCASYDQGRWLEEENFELIKDFPVAHMSRSKKQLTGQSPLEELFKDRPPFFVADSTIPPRDELLKLIRKCGGQFTSCLQKAELCIGNRSQSDMVAVEEKWLLDCIMKSEVLDIDKYVINTPNP